VIGQGFADQVSNAVEGSRYSLLKLLLGLLRYTSFAEPFHIAEVERGVCSYLRVQTVSVSLSKCKAFNLVLI
jgi:hypothetical protein